MNSSTLPVLLHCFSDFYYMELNKKGTLFLVCRHCWLEHDLTKSLMLPIS